MEVTVSACAKSICLAVERMIISTSVDLHFCSEAESFGAFHQLKTMGVECYHAGKNSPVGPTVFLYPESKVKFSVKD